MHPYKPLVLHVDFQRVDATHEIHIKVPLHFVNDEIAPGVKLSGGLVNHVMTEVDVQCLPKDLPEFIEVDLSALDVGDSIHLSELKLPKGVKLVRTARRRLGRRRRRRQGRRLRRSRSCRRRSGCRVSSGTALALAAAGILPPAAFSHLIGHELHRA